MAIKHHGLESLVFHLGQNCPGWSQWPVAFTQRLKAFSYSYIGLELHNRSETEQLLRDLMQHNVRPIVLKGAALSHTIYQHPWLRQRGDMDLLLPPKHIGKAIDILEHHGYQFMQRPGLLGQEVGFTKEGCFPIDLHWRLSSYFLLSQIIRYDELLASAVPMTGCYKHPCAIHPVYALLHACMHWAKHKASGDFIKLIWLHDIHLLTQKLTTEQQLDFIRLAQQKQLSIICTACLQAVHEIFDDSECQQLIARLEPLSKGTQEPSARLLQQQASPFTALDLMRSPDLVSNLADAFLPPAAIIRRQYPRLAALPLPLIYGARWVNVALEYTRRKLRR